MLCDAPDCEDNACCLVEPVGDGEDPVFVIAVDDGEKKKKKKKKKAKSSHSKSNGKAAKAKSEYDEVELQE